MISKADKLANERDLSAFCLLWLYKTDSIPLWGIALLTASIITPLLGWHQFLNYQFDDAAIWFARSGSVGCALGALSELLLLKHTTFTNRVERAKETDAIFSNLRSKFGVIDAKLDALMGGETYVEGAANITLLARHQVVYSKNMDKLRGTIPKVNTAVSAIGIISIVISSFIWGYGDIFYAQFN